MNKPLIFFLVIIISTNGFSQLPNGSGFSITGKISGLPDSTSIYPDIIENDIINPRDTTLIIGGRFYFKGSIASEVEHMIIRTRDFSDYKFLWLENAPVTFTAENGKFRQARITGSKTQDE